MDIQKLIAQARAKAAEPVSQLIVVEVGDELVEILLKKVDGSTWGNLTAACPPREDVLSDMRVGYNTDAVAPRYPVEYILVCGETIDQESWAELTSLLESPWQKAIAASLWGMHQNDPEKRAAELGKALAAATSK